jgi:predicted DNA-binding transcriptional regulator YafY
MRAARLLSIQMMLETRGQLSARELAAALEISVRTLHRDVDHLSAAGVPIVATRGRSGGFRLLEGWNTRLTGLTPSEARAVFLSGLSGPAAQLGMQQPMRSAQLKVLSSLPAAWRDEAQSIQDRLHLDPVDWYRDPEPAPCLATVADAVWRGRKLSMRYQGWRGMSARVTCPLGLVLKAGTWYFVGHADETYRTYRVAGIRTVEILDERFKRPKRFDLARHWQDAVASFERSIYTGTAHVLATAAGLRALSALNSAAARAAAAAPPPDSGRRATVRLPIESIESATGQLLGLAPEVEVIEPRALRRSIQRRLRELARLYQVNASRVPSA